MTRKINRLFIANRGEIARRIAITAKRLGLETAMVTDRQVPPAYFFGLVDHWIYVEEESPALYLNLNSMVELALSRSCDGLHPGFGFLSENAEFAQKVLDSGMIWVGPNPKAIAAMASKGSARSYAENAQVPCLAGLNGFPVPESSGGDWSVLEGFASKTPYPLLIKAAYGGGGKGMRLVEQASDLRNAALRAKSEALSSFGNESLICEQYLVAPRHIEVQILADQHGTISAIGDRDCSLQRRHQKIIEEAPAPNLTPKTRKALHAAAINLAKQVGYDSAGTVEFLLDWSPNARDLELQKFYFLEMNTRLQVEHPVTEEVFGLDLVEWQLRVACGEPLPESFSSLSPRGHSIEARVYAEDVAQNFFPAPGPIAAFHPAEGPGVRWERGIDSVDVVTGRFDPMIAKLIATGADRKTALARLKDALSRSFLAGPANNIELLMVLCESDFAKEPVSTHFLKDRFDHLLNSIQEERLPFDGLAQNLLSSLEEHRFGAHAISSGAISPSAITALAFTNGYGDLKIDGLNRDSSETGILSTLEAHWYTALSPQQTTRSGLGWCKAGDGKDLGFWYAILKLNDTRRFWIQIYGKTFVRDLTRASVAGATTTALGQDEIVAPVPGKVIAINIKVGDRIKSGTIVFILESMKMEFEVKTTRSGCIRTINAKVGEQVTAGYELATWSEDGNEHRQKSTATD